MDRLIDGTTIKSQNGTEYLVEQMLSEAGSTAIVYKAMQAKTVRPVALKVLRDGLPDNIAQDFRDEAFTLGELAQAQQADEERGKRFTPLVIEESLASSEAVRFLAMELVEGVSLERLLSQTYVEDETQALLMASQMLYVLNLLHTQIRKSYLDFQLKNIWWQEENQQIMVMDWGLVSRRAPQGEVPPTAPDDLLKFGRYLYQILTTKGVYTDGEPGYALQKRAGDRWHEISAGTRYILRKAVHPNPAHRYQTAKAFQADVDEQLALLQGDPFDVETDAVGAVRFLRKQMNEGENFSAEKLRRAEIYVDALGRLTDDDPEVTRLQREIETITGEVSAEWGAGKQYYSVNAFSETLERWEGEAQAWQRPDLWRWVLLARIGRKVRRTKFTELKPTLESAIAYMNATLPDWEAALALLQQAQQQGAGGVVPLIAEAKAHIAFDDATLKKQNKLWREAAEQYQEAHRQLQEVEYADLLAEYDGLDNLQELAQECLQNIRTTEEEHQRLRQTLSDYKQALHEEQRHQYGSGTNRQLSPIYVLQKAIQATPDDPMLIQTIQTLADQSRDWTEKRGIYETLMAYARLSKPAQHKVAESVVEDAIDNDDWSAVSRWLPRLTNTTAQSQTLKREFNEAIQGRDTKRALDLLQPLALIDPEQATQRMQIVEQTLEKFEEDRKVARAQLAYEVGRKVLLDNKDAALKDIGLSLASHRDDLRDIKREFDELNFLFTDLVSLRVKANESETLHKAILNKPNIITFSQLIRVCNEGIEQLRQLFQHPLAQKLKPELRQIQSQLDQRRQEAQIQRETFAKKLKHQIAEQKVKLSNADRKELADLEQKIDDTQEIFVTLAAHSQLVQDAELVEELLALREEFEKNVLNVLKRKKKDFHSSDEAAISSGTLNEVKRSASQWRIGALASSLLVLFMLPMIIFGIPQKGLACWGFERACPDADIQLSADVTNTPEVENTVVPDASQTIEPTEEDATATTAPTETPEPTATPQPTATPVRVALNVDFTNGSQFVVPPDSIPLTAEGAAQFLSSGDGTLLYEDEDGMEWNVQLQVNGDAPQLIPFDMEPSTAITIPVRSMLPERPEPQPYMLALALTNIDDDGQQMEPFELAQFEIEPLTFEPEVTLAEADDENGNYYAVPDFSMTAPTNWHFDLSGETLQAIDPFGQPHTVTYVLTGTVDLNEADSAAGSTITSTQVLTRSISLPTLVATTTGSITDTRAITITWSVSPTLISDVVPAIYTYSVAVRSVEYEEFPSTNNLFTLIEPPFLRIMMSEDNSCRTAPVWDSKLKYSPDVSQVIREVYILGRIFVEAREDLKGNFLYVQRQDTEETCWLPNTSTDVESKLSDDVLSTLAEVDEDGNPQD